MDFNIKWDFNLDKTDNIRVGRNLNFELYRIQVSGKVVYFVYFWYTIYYLYLLNQNSKSEEHCQ